MVEPTQIGTVPLRRLQELQRACRDYNIPAPYVFPDQRGGLHLQWQPPRALVEIGLHSDGTTRWVDPARSRGITFDVFDAETFARRVEEWYNGGPMIGGEPFSLEDDTDDTDDDEA